MGRSGAWTCGARTIVIVLVSLLSLANYQGTSFATETSLTDALDLPGDRIVAVSTLGTDPRAAGVFRTGLAGFPLVGDSFVILSTGAAADAYLPDTNNNERVGAGGWRDDVSTVLNGATTNMNTDMAQLQVTLEVPGWARGFSFDFTFLSEEWPDYLYSFFNDKFVVQVGDAELFVDPLGGVSAPNNMTSDERGGLVSIHSGWGFDRTKPNPDTGTTYDGSTGLLTTSFPLPRTERTMTITFTVFDAFDSQLDSAVFLDNLRFTRTAPPEPQTVPAISSGPTDLLEGGKITGGGSVGGPGEAGIFAGNVQVGPHDDFKGNWLYTSQDGSHVIQSVDIMAMGFEQTQGWFEGTGLVNGEPGYRLRVTVVDHGEPGSEDDYRIEVWRTDRLGPESILSEGGTLQTGNVQVHPPHGGS